MKDQAHSKQKRELESAHVMCACAAGASDGYLATDDVKQNGD